ncbi:putative ATP-grasp-modified RiPP [Streptomyces bacillaris]|uniref:putative ATP-grasp-modified RiPP n=1 Tax=Streptomyces TaxID=1883 RepID=UPI0015863961|nr:MULTISPECIES: putative ATP-grasp-modified RiPP [Streptomyces]NUV44122.1 putative ATP-grasp-modified RiPP [Streptomyces sp. CAI-24]WAE69668.1 putative ATP-grasp-modified RiPP [Streptomyces cavourensis]
MNVIEPLPLGRPAPVAHRSAQVRPYALQGARFTPVDLSVPWVETRVYDRVTQTATMADGTPLITMDTIRKTNPGGGPKNLSPHDEGSDPGFLS